MAGRNTEAIPYLEEAAIAEPGNAAAHFRLGLALHSVGRAQSAIAHLGEAIRLEPDNAAMLWQTAWIRATSPDPQAHDGARAIELAERAIELSDGKETGALDALAAALAETQDFSAALEAAERAQVMALAQGDDRLAAAIEQRMALYRQGLPYRNEAAAEPAAP